MGAGVSAMSLLFLTSFGTLSAKVGVAEPALAVLRTLYDTFCRQAGAPHPRRRASTKKERIDER